MYNILKDYPQIMKKCIQVLMLIFSVYRLHTSLTRYKLKAMEVKMYTTKNRWLISKWNVSASFFFTDHESCNIALIFA